jgi:hypothetical protein
MCVASLFTIHFYDFRNLFQKYAVNSLKIFSLKEKGRINS